MLLFEDSFHGPENADRKNLEPLARALGCKVKTFRVSPTSTVTVASLKSTLRNGVSGMYVNGSDMQTYAGSLRELMEAMLSAMSLRDCVSHEYSGDRKATRNLGTIYHNEE